MAASTSDLGITENGKPDKTEALEGSMEQLNLETAAPQSSLLVESDLNDDDFDFWNDDETSNNSVDNGLSSSSALDRDWKLRYEHFHTMGYRDGITSGKEASAQEGFNMGFKQSVHNGYNWGLVRGISSAAANLPDHLKEKMAGRTEERNRLQNLYQNVQMITTTDALKMYHESILHTKTKCCGHSESCSQLITCNGENSSCNQLDSLSNELTSLLRDLPELNMTKVPIHGTSGQPSYAYQ